MQRPRIRGSVHSAIRAVQADFQAGTTTELCDRKVRAQVDSDWSFDPDLCRLRLRMEFQRSLPEQAAIRSSHQCSHSAQGFSAILRTSHTRRTISRSVGRRIQKTGVSLAVGSRLRRLAQRIKKSHRSDLNRGPTLYESVALPTELRWLDGGKSSPRIRCGQQ